MTATPMPHSLGDLPSLGPAVVTMGVFDGVHLGHRAVLEATQRASHEHGASSVALIFDPHPEELLKPGHLVPRLAPTDVNRSRVLEAGIDEAPIIRFDAELRALPAEDFLAGLSERLALRAVVMSTRSAFGRNLDGTVDHVRRLGEQGGFEVVAVEPVELDGDVVSSTRIREAIAGGDIAAARRLGVPPYLEGTVVVGDRRGRDLGFPTANLAFGYKPALPSLGIYAARVTRGGPAGQAALVSIGTRPTFEERGAVVAEVHLLDFSGDLYGALLGVELAARLRDELRFEAVPALVEQMHLDEENARAVLGQA